MNAFWAFLLFACAGLKRINIEIINNNNKIHNIGPPLLFKLVISIRNLYSYFPLFLFLSLDFYRRLDSIFHWIEKIDEQLDIYGHHQRMQSTNKHWNKTRTHWRGRGKWIFFSNWKVNNKQTKNGAVIIKNLIIFIIEQFIEWIVFYLKWNGWSYQIWLEKKT